MYKLYLTLTLALVFIAARAGAATQIYHGGDILTMAGNQPDYVDALLVRDGEIAFTGSHTQALKMAGEGATSVDLQGRTLLPGFIDAHSHFMMTAAKLATVALDPPPAGDITSIADIVARLQIELEEHPRTESEWLIGWGFDNGMLQEGRFPNRQDLDRVSPNVPVLLMHFSGHMMVINSAGLARAGYDTDYQPPEGGAIQRQPNGELNGVIEETAMFQALQVLSRDVLGPDAKPRLGLPLTEQENLRRMKEAQQLYLGQGFTTISEMAGSPADLALLGKLRDSNELLADIVVYLHSATASQAQVKTLYTSGYDRHLRVGGGKINLDGGSPGRTAFLRQPYYTPTPGKPEGYRGYSSIPDQDKLNQLVAGYYQQRVPVSIHALGDAAIDQCIAAVDFAQNQHPYADIRTQLIHLQVMQEDQFDSLQKLDVTLTFQNTHNYYFADFHYSTTLGPARTRKLNAMASAFQRNFSTTFHHDSPVHPVDQILLIWIAVNRTGRSGTLYGPEERLSPYQALRAATIEAAYQFREEAHKGSLEVNKLADMVILSENPLKVDPVKIRDIQVLETIKEGEQVFRKSAPQI